MKASETEFKKIIEGTSQFFVPHYQRPYSWERKQWHQLWDDIVSLVSEREADTQGPKPTHFIGSMVTAPGSSVPQGVAKYVLIDGQQRVTTLMILLTVLRDVFRERESRRRADMIHDLFLTNQYQEGLEHFKILPTQGEDPETSDRTAFIRLVDPSKGPKVTGHRATVAYDYFAHKVRSRATPDPELLLDAITAGLLLVSIVLDRDDNPYTIFESLNAKGRALSEADLIRNFFFMRIDQHEHERAYHGLWQPVEKMLANANMTEFFRQYLMRDGSSVRSDRVYMEIKQTAERRSSRLSPFEHLQEIHRFASHYATLSDPQREGHPKVRAALANLQRLNFGVTASFLLNLYDDFAGGRISPDVMAETLAVIENYLLRRYVCGVPSNALNKIFPALYRQSREEGRFNLERMKSVLAEKGYPTDEEFRHKLAEVRLYGGGDRRDKAKVILERLEASFEHKERVGTGELTIEHVMPQTLTPAWRSVLGEEVDELHDLYLHRLGNLTLTGYNSELSNDPYEVKRIKLAESHVELNRYFAACERWDFAAITKRSEALAARGMAIWPSFRPARESPVRSRGVVTGTKPSVLFIGDERVEVKDWSDVLLRTMKYLCENHSDSFPDIEEEFRKCVAEDARSLRTPRQLDNGYHYEANMSAQRIYKVCEQIMDFVGSGDQWRVETRS